jgi:hypothetical protein
MASADCTNLVWTDLIKALLAVVASLEQQHQRRHDVLNYMAAACKTALRGEATTSLLTSPGHLEQFMRPAAAINE